jgi:hypothetical protein
VDLNKCNVSRRGQQVKKCCPLRPATYINAQNGVKSLEREFSQFMKRMQYLTEKKNTQQATGNASFFIAGSFIVRIIYIKGFYS